MVKGCMTDLALESRDFLREGGVKEPIPGVREEKEEIDGIAVTRIRILTEEAAEKLGKGMGSYVTLETGEMLRAERASRDTVSRRIAGEMQRILPRREGENVLVIGLGNRSVTPDALGPMAVDGIMVSRHILEAIPEGVDSRVQPLCAIAPGVLGNTGMETAEMLRGVIGRVHPACVVAVDALASRSTGRMGNTFQLSDAGICPGAGVGNRRETLDRESLGVPVLAMGVPTVVYAATIVRDAMLAMDRESPVRRSEGEMDAVVGALLPPSLEGMVVTSKDVDRMTAHGAEVLAMGINLWAHPGMDTEDIRDFMH